MSSAGSPSATIAVLSLTGALALWHVVVLASIYSVGTAFFNPAFDAIVPELLPADSLAQANSLDQFVRPVAMRLAGPALGGLVIAQLGVGVGFALDAASFAVSAGLPAGDDGARAGQREAEHTSVAGEIRAGFEYVRRHAWLWATLASAAIAYLLFMGPTEVLVPFVVKNELHASAAALGLVFAAGGFGSVACAIGFAPARSAPARDHLDVRVLDAWPRSRSPATG